MQALVRALLARWVPSRRGKVASTDFKALVDNSLDLIVRCGPDQIATYASPASTAMLGVTPEQLIGRSHLEFIHPDDRAGLDGVIERHLAGARDARATFRMIRADQTIIWVEGSGRMVLDPATGRTDFVVTMRDVTINKRNEEQLAALTLTDALTGLGNRRAFDEALEREWRRSLRSGASLSLLMLDVDSFKSFNDQYGHQAGDDCLRAVASVIPGKASRAGDLAARYGGEEIAVILADSRSETAREVAEAIRAGIEALAIPHAGNAAGRRIVTVSIGIASAIPPVGASVRMPEALLKAADAALYDAKRNGRNRTEMSPIPRADEPRTNVA